MRTESGNGRERVKAAFCSLFKKWDLLLIAVVLVAAVLSVLFALREDGGEVRVYRDGELRYTFSLTDDGEYVILDGRMTIAVRDGAVSVVASDCEEQLCVHSAPCSAEGSMIVCLPNHVVIEIGEREVDAIT